VTATAERGGTLFVVATPIGNLGDVSTRAVETLRDVALIAAEDTRVTRRLLTRYAIATPTVSYHARNAVTREPELLARLRAGDDLALVTDAGTPGVSDPGDSLVMAWATEGGRAVSVPGPSAVLAALASTGIAGPRWTFEGFLPRSGRERRDRIARIAADARGCVLFEAPNRLAATLRDLAAACGSERGAAVCRELTKLHEEIVRGDIGSLAGRAARGEIDQRGEAVIVIGWSEAASGTRAASRVSEEDARAEVGQLVASGIGRSEAARRVSAATGLPRRRLYAVRDEQGRD
jgi:16S rRNA (cytidine1402-2'-O)-methyltransferase